MTDTFRRVPCDSIKILRDDRQRREVPTDDLEFSIGKYGVLSPIIVTDDLTLIAGERRLTTSLKLGLPDIPVRIFSDLSQVEKQIYEFIENLKRKDLTWQEECISAQTIHTLFCKEQEWSIEKTANELGESISWVARKLQVAKELGDPKIAAFDTFNTALNFLRRRNERKVADAMADLAQDAAALFDDSCDLPDLPLDSDLADFSPTPNGSGEGGGNGGGNPLPRAGARTPVPRGPNSLEDEVNAAILHCDFLEWIKDYDGPSFNFIHCDFPYGVNVFGGKWSGRDGHENYSDSKDVYFSLLETFLENLDKILGHSGHLLFWFSMDFYTETMELFEHKAPSLVVQKKPLIWAKTDNVGICSDPVRRPRHVYETALIATREDRPLVKPCSDFYGAPTAKTFHHSTKPESVLKHFFTMFVDESTSMFDPTCGSGSALRAAEALGAKSILGLERDEEIVKSARSALRQFKALRSVKG